MSWFEVYVTYRDSYGHYQIRERSAKAASRLAQVLFARELNICWFSVDVEYVGNLKL